MVGSWNLTILPVLLRQGSDGSQLVMQVRNETVASHHVSVLTGDNILGQFGKLEKMVANSTPSLEEHPVLEHFPNSTTEMVHDSNPEPKQSTDSCRLRNLYMQIVNFMK